ncbi:hypothetical protein NMG60_11032133 [Bertholletia excelsa]
MSDLSKMLSKSKCFKVLLHWRVPKSILPTEDCIPHLNGKFDYSYNSFSTMTESSKLEKLLPVSESPELPGWVKFSEKNNLQVENSEDDFFPPSISYWVDQHKLRDQRNDAKRIVCDMIDNDVDRVRLILNNQFQSLDDAIQALHDCSVNVSESLVGKLLKRFSNNWIPAFGFFKWAKLQRNFKHSAELYNSMVDILGKGRKFDLMWGLLEEMNQLKGYISLVTMTKVMRRLAKAFRYDDAIEAFRRMEQFGLSKDVEAMNALMGALVKENSVEHAQQVYVEYKDFIPPNSRTFNILIHGWCKAREMEKASSTMGDMVELGFQPDVFSYTCFVEAHCLDKNFHKVDAILEEMKEKGCPPNSVTYTIVMHALGKAKEYNRVLEIYEKMKQSGCVLDSFFYSSLVYSLSKAGRLKDAREIFEDMSNQGVSPDGLTYKTMITAACEHSQEENALELLRHMGESHCKPDLSIYAPLLKMCCRKKRMKVLSFLLNHMFENDVSLDLGTYSLLVHGLCKSGLIEHACSFFEEAVLRGFIPQDCTYAMLMKELESKGMKKAKQQIEQLMFQARCRTVGGFPFHGA